MTDLQDADDLDKFDEDIPSIEHCVVFVGDRLHFTNPGLARFRKRFALAGIDIRGIKTRDQFVLAMRASFPYWWGRIVAQIAAKPSRSYRQRIERGCIVAIMLGDRDETKRLTAILDRLNARPLELIRPE
jgi:hypothetical protein